MTEQHLSRNFDPEELNGGYYCDRTTGEYLGTSVYDYEPEEVESYYITVNNVTWVCQSCGYEGNRYHPRRNRPTIESPLHRDCPKTDCPGQVKNKAAEENN
jgi:hypothetical protein